MHSALWPKESSPATWLTGFAVLRFDHLCTGDSAYPQTCPDVADNWRRSIGYKIDYRLKLVPAGHRDRQRAAESCSATIQTRKPVGGAG